MKLSLLSFCVFALIFLCLILIASFGQGFGYVFVQWHGWQLQSNLFLVFVVYLLFALILFGLSYAVARYLRPKLSKYRVAKSFQQLHPYERMGIMWLLQGQQSIPDVILIHYQSSILLYPLVHAKLLIQQGQYEQAQQILQKYNYNLFELSEVLHIEIDQKQQHYHDVRQRLDFLSVQTLSTWLQPLEQVYQQKIQQLYSDYANACAWQFVDFHRIEHFNVLQKQQWLDALLQNMKNAKQEERDAFLQSMQDPAILDNIKMWSVQNQQGLLKICHEYTELDEYTLSLAQSILQQVFMPDTLYIWLEQSFKVWAMLPVASQSDYLQQMQQFLQQWQHFELTQPSYAFAQWYIHAKQGKMNDSEELLMRFPEDRYILYLHLQQQLVNTTLWDGLQVPLLKLLKA